MKRAAVRRRDVDTALVFALAGFASLLSFLIYFQRGDVLLYGDAVAHINIARKVFDSQTPGLLQLGTVWLPLPHLLMIPFLRSNWMWTTGIGGSAPSMVAYVFLVAGVFRLVRGALSRYGDASGSANGLAWLAAAIVGLNPNLLYLQSTAMTEVPYLAWFVWAIVFFAEFVKETLASESAISDAARSKLTRCAWCVAAAEWTRYDGWFFAAVIGVSAIAVLHRFRHLAGIKGVAAKFLVVVSLPVLLWLGYNAIVYRNPLEFATGPYSAKAIERKTSVPGYPPHPGAQDPPMAALYFFKSAQVNMAEGGWEKIWALLLVVGALVCAGSSRGLRPLLLLLVPLPFYMLSVAYSGVPVFVPPWWPFSYYNVRYGVQLLPAFAAMTAVVVSVIVELVHSPRGRVAVGVCALALVAGSYARVWSRGPVCFREAWVNSRTRIALGRELARHLKSLPENARFLMYLGDHVGTMQNAGIDLRRVIHEGNHRPWKKPSDPDGIWEKALANPRAHVEYVISFDGDDVDRMMNREGLTLKWVVNTPGQPVARVWETQRIVD
jgi:hypothetical protein